MGHPRRHCALVALLAIAVHATALRSGFIWLDHAHLTDRLALAPPGAWLSLFEHGFAGTGFYRPLTALLLSIDAAITPRPWLFHATAVLWHAAAAVCTTLAAASLGLSRQAALGAGVLFAVHPLSSLVAGAIAFQSEAMLAAALLALIVLHRRAHPAAGLALLVGALTKETALLLAPLSLAALEVDAPKPRPPLRARFTVGCSEAAGWSVALGLRIAFAPAWRARGESLPPSDALGTRFAALAKSALRAALPFDPTVCDAFPVTSMVSPAALAGLGIAAGALYLASKRRGPALLLTIALLPSLHVVPIMRWWSPHYLYVPFAFASMLASEWIALQKAALRTWAVAATSLLALRTAIADMRFESDVVLWSDEIAAQPACREGHFYLGETAREERRFDDAARAYERAVAPSPGMLSYVDATAALQNLGVVRLELGKLDDARQAFRAALDVVSDEGERRHLLHNLATAELRAGNAEEAARLLEKEVERADALDASIVVRARAVERLGRIDEARALMRRLQARLPNRR
jgi:tetratricopeptide (TPR) repeat protein